MQADLPFIEDNGEKDCPQSDRVHSMTKEATFHNATPQAGNKIRIELACDQGRSQFSNIHSILRAPPEE